MKAKVEGKKVELTDWFPPHIKPVHVGWYHTGCGDYKPDEDTDTESDYNWYWDGNKWTASPDGFICSIQNRYWRGLAQPWGEP